MLIIILFMFFINRFVELVISGSTWDTILLCSYVGNVLQVFIHILIPNVGLCYKVYRINICLYISNIIQFPPLLYNIFSLYLIMYIIIYTYYSLLPVLLLCFIDINILLTYIYSILLTVILYPYLSPIVSSIIMLLVFYLYYHINCLYILSCYYILQ
jgi:hypothetical protein